MARGISSRRPEQALRYGEHWTKVRLTARKTAGFRRNHPDTGRHDYLYSSSSTAFRRGCRGGRNHGHQHSRGRVFSHRNGPLWPRDRLGRPDAGQRTALDPGHPHRRVRARLRARPGRIRRLGGSRRLRVQEDCGPRNRRHRPGPGPYGQGGRRPARPRHQLLVPLHVRPGCLPGRPHAHSPCRRCPGRALEVRRRVMRQLAGGPLLLLPPPRRPRGPRRRASPGRLPLRICPGGVSGAGRGGPPARSGRRNDRNWRTTGAAMPSTRPTATCRPCMRQPRSS